MRTDDDFLLSSVFVLWFVFQAIPACLIAKKAGFNAAIGILYGIPIVGLVAMWFFACVAWPVSKNRSTAIGASLYGPKG